MDQPDILIINATAVTMDADRRVVDDAWVLVKRDRIAAIGSGSQTQPGTAKKIIDGSGMVAMPGLIDSHSHAGHGLVRAAGAGDFNLWIKACEEIYARGSTNAFWRAEARLTQLERLRAGITTAISLLGGGADIYRTDDPSYGDAHSEATVESGLRTLLAVGPCRAPFPKKYRNYSAEGPGEVFDLSFQRQLNVSAELIDRWNDVLRQRTGVCLIMPVYSAAEIEDAERRKEIAAMSEAVTDLRRRKAVLLVQDGHREGSIEVARDLGLLGPFALLSHSIDLTPSDFAALKETGASIVHNPSAIMSVYGRCPVPELIEAGVTVCLGSDASAPDRGYDMFRHMAQCMHYHRRHFRDPTYMPPGKILEMATIDAATALGLHADIGSLEPGKKADIILVDMRKAHLYPPVMPITRLAHFATAADVDTVIVDGAVLMENRRVCHLDEAAILADAAREGRLAFGRTGLTSLLVEPAEQWGQTKRTLEQHSVPSGPSEGKWRR